MQKTQVQSLGWEDPLEKGMATHASILVWEILWTGEPGMPQSMGLQRVGHLATRATKTRSLVLPYVKGSGGRQSRIGVAASNH